MNSQTIGTLCVLLRALQPLALVTAILPAAIVPAAVAQETFGSAEAAAGVLVPTTRGEVGAWAGPRALVFEGNRAFSGATLLQALAWEPDFHAAAYPDAPLDPYLEMLRRRVLAGYQRVGFLEASVTTRADSNSGKVHVGIREGRRFTAGRLLIEGVPADVDTQLRQRLAIAPPTTPGSGESYVDFPSLTLREAPRTPDAPATDATTARPGWPWVEGRPAPSDAAALEGMRLMAARALVDLNYHGARVELRLMPNPEEVKADLKLTVAGLGTPGMLDQIEVKGLKRDSRDALLSFLDLKPGIPLPQTPEQSIAHKLWASARYLHHDVTLVPLPAPGRYRIELDLEEWTNAPAIDQPLSAEGQARLKLGEWLVANDQWTHDPVLTVDIAPTQGQPARVEWVLVPDGMLLTLSKPPDPAATNSDAPSLPRFAAVLSKRLRALYAPGHLRKLTLPRLGMAWTAGIHLGRNPRGSEDPLSLMMGLSFLAGPNALDAPPFRVSAQADPVCFLALGDPLKTRSRLENGILRIQTLPAEIQDTPWNDDFEGQLSAEALTGRLIELSGSEPIADTRIRLRAVTTEGAFARRVEQLARAAAGYRETFDPKRAWASSFEFVAAELAELPPEWFDGPWTQAVGGMPFLPLFRLLAAMEWDSIGGALEGTFGTSEADWGRERFPAASTVDAKASATGAGLLLNLGGNLWPSNSWPAALWRDAVLLRNGYPDLVLARLSRRAAAGDIGPLECLLSAMALRDEDLPLIGRFLEIGLAHLRPAEGIADLGTALEGDAPGAYLLRQLARGLATASEADFASLRSFAGPRLSPLMRVARDALRTRTNAPIERVMVEAIRRAWPDAVEPALRLALEATPPGVREPTTPVGQFQRGRTLARGMPGAPGDLAAAIPWLRRAAEAGCAEAQVVYGDLLRHGQGVDRDPPAAIVWYRKAAEQDVAHAGCRLGTLLLSIEGPERNPREAKRWLDAELKHGCGNAAFHIGLITLQGGPGDPPDWTAALPWFQRAWDLNHPPAAYLLAKAHSASGHDRQAVEWLEKAARKGIVEAQAELGDRLSDGFSPGQDAVQASTWLRLAVDGGHKISEFRLRSVEDRLTPDQRAAAKRRADRIAAEILGSR